MSDAARDPDYDSLALQLYAASSDNAMDRFIRSLPEQMRHDAEETLRLRDEFSYHATRVLTEDTRKAGTHATWVAEHAGEVAYRWGVLRDAMSKWARYDIPTFKVVSR